MVPVFSSLVAFLLPVFVLFRKIKHCPPKRAYLYSVGSFASALIALCLEVVTVRRRVFSGDFGGIQDTMDAVVILCIAIAIVTTLLNLLALVAVYAEKN